jgi:hypothetical protein
MTSLPSLPPNLDPNCISCGSVSALTSQLTTGIVATTAGQLAQAQGAIAGQTAQLQGLVAQVNAGSAASLALIEAAISQDVVNQLLARYTSPEGVPDIKCVADELQKAATTLEDANEKLINAQQLPPISISGVLASLFPSIPVLTVPSPAEIKTYISNLIERKKQEQRDAIAKLQKAKADADELSFMST